MLSMGLGMIDPNNPITELNSKLHQSDIYNSFQTGVSMVSSFTGAASQNMACFIAGTMVLTTAGLVAIEKIKAGDIVISTNPDTLETAEKPVLETYVRQVDKLVHLTINGEEIVTTIDHPFYVQGRGFIKAGKLLVGDKLVSVNGEDLLVDGYCIEECEAPTTVYNFQVEDYHTYFVGESKVWVHNADYPKSPGQYEKAPYHNKGNSVKSAAPTNGQEALNRSVPIKSTTSRRVSVDGNNFVVFDETSPGIFHGHTRSWSELTQTMKNALIKSGLANSKGKIL